METGREVVSKVKPKARARFVDSSRMFLLAEKREADDAIRATESASRVHPTKNRALWSLPRATQGK